MGLLVAIGTLSAHVLGVPIGVARVFPVQHSINVLSAVWLGPGRAVLVALVISALRNALGTGTPLAFPGSVFGALLAGLAYRATGRPGAAVLGELVGTGVVGSAAAYWLASQVLGQQPAALTLALSFMASAGVGAAVAYWIVRSLRPLGR